MNPLALAIRAAVAPPAKDLLYAYFEPNRPFAGATFDTLPNNDASRFTPEDIVAASLLDVRFTPLAVRALLDPDGEPANKLRAIRADVQLWDQDAGEALAKANDAWRAVRKLDGVGPTRASKLLARKRPRLIPIVDSVIRKALPSLGTDSWAAFRAALQSSDLREEVMAVRPEVAPKDTTVLRLIDVAVWMRCSGSRNARGVREGVASRDSTTAGEADLCHLCTST
ncbi:MAG: DUF6308 family protein [Pedococcus sp.]